jgi:tetratricopeptide (TPR) repeat protein
MVLYTDNNGGFGFTGLSEGVYTLEVSGDVRLYDSVVQEVRLIRGTHVRLNINLKERAGNHPRSPGNVVSLAELQQKVPDAARKEFEAGTRLVNEEKIREGIERFKKAIAIYPEYLMARNDLGVQYLKLKMLAEAIEQFEAALEVNPKVFNPRLNIGIALVQQKKYADAIDHLNLAISINGSSASAHLHVGVASLETDELATAERELAAALTLGGTEYAVAHYYAGHVQLKKGEREAAIREFKAFLEAQPTGDLASRARQILEKLQA